MSLGWDEMKEQADDKQTSGAKLRKAISGPFKITCMEVRNEFGTVIGELVIEELIRLTRDDPWVVRAGLWWAADQMPVAPRKATSGESAGPDEDAHE